MHPEYKKLYERLQDRQVQQLLLGVEGDLARLNPHGAKNDDLPSIRQTLLHDARLTQQEYGEDLTLAQYMEKEPDHCERDIKAIGKAIVLFGITI